MFFKFDKRGAIHVDWAISMGIFLIYVIFLFTLIKPGYYEEFKPENLFTIVEGNFIKNTVTSVKEIQFVIESCGGNGNFKLEDSNGRYKFSELFRDGVLINKDDGSVTTPGISIGNQINIICGEPNYPIINKDSWVVFTATSYPNVHLDFANINSVPKYLTTCNHPSGKVENCKASLGAITEFKGLDESYVNELKTKSYSNLLNEWGFPTNKKFNITVTNLRDQNIMEISDGETPLEGINIFVKEFNNIYLNKYNERENVKVRMVVW